MCQFESVAKIEGSDTVESVGTDGRRLIVAPLAQAYSGKGDRDHELDLGFRLAWPAQSSHPPRDRPGEGGPAAVLEGVDDLTDRSIEEEPGTNSADGGPVSMAHG